MKNSICRLSSDTRRGCQRAAHAPNATALTTTYSEYSGTRFGTCTRGGSSVYRAGRSSQTSRPKASAWFWRTRTSTAAATRCWGEAGLETAAAKSTRTSVTTSIGDGSMAVMEARGDKARAPRVAKASQLHTLTQEPFVRGVRHSTTWAVSRPAFVGSTQTHRAPCVSTAGGGTIALQWGGRRAGQTGRGAVAPPTVECQGPRARPAGAGPQASLSLSPQ